jgi:hypothetical protein
MKAKLRQTVKYLLRFGLLFIIAAPIVYFVMGPRAIATLTYKLCLVSVFAGLAELLWAIGYRLFFGKMEAMQSNERLGVLIFRGLFYGSIIIAGTLGL